MRSTSHPREFAELAEQFERNVHCLLGLPIDAADMATAIDRIRVAAARRIPCFVSTANLNWVIACRTDDRFRDSVINSDLSVADGMPLIWVARLLGVPIRERVAGSDIFERLRAEAGGRLAVYFFGGIEGAAEEACLRLNAESSGLVCAGFTSPGFGSVEEMSDDGTLAKINASGADFVVVSLGARKGQAWIERNRARITVPVISHLGAVVNFVAGTAKRAPVLVQRVGLEWLWRIKEEPGLATRYAADGWAFLRLFVTRVLPHAALVCYRRAIRRETGQAAVQRVHDDVGIVLHLSGAWTLENLQPLRECFSCLVSESGDVRIDVARVTDLDSAFLGLLMLLYGERKRRGWRVVVERPRDRIVRLFRYSCSEFLLEAR